MYDEKTHYFSGFVQSREDRKIWLVLLKRSQIILIMWKPTIHYFLENGLKPTSWTRLPNKNRCYAAKAIWLCLVNGLFWQLSRLLEGSKFVTVVEVAYSVSATARNQPNGLCFHDFVMTRTCACAYLFSTNEPPQRRRSRIYQQIFKQTSTSRNTTYRQSWNLQAMLPGEVLKG